MSPPSMPPPSAGYAMTDPTVMVAVGLVVISTLILLFRAFSGPSKAKFLNKPDSQPLPGEKAHAKPEGIVTVQEEGAVMKEFSAGHTG